MFTRQSGVKVLNFTCQRRNFTPFLADGMGLPLNFLSTNLANRFFTCRCRILSAFCDWQASFAIPATIAAIYLRTQSTMSFAIPATIAAIYLRTQSAKNISVKSGYRLKKSIAVWHTFCSFVN